MVPDCPLTGTDCARGCAFGVCQTFEDANHMRNCTEPGCKIPEPHEAHDKSYDVAAHLERVKAIIGERGTTRDKPGGERSMAKCVRIFNAMAGRDLTAADGWRFMLALKLARMMTGRYKADDYDDLTGYSALLAEEARAESAAREQEPVTEECAWCSKPCTFMHKPGTHGVVCQECVTNGPPTDDD